MHVCFDVCPLSAADTFYGKKNLLLLTPLLLYNAKDHEENSRKSIVNEFVMHYFYPQRQLSLLYNLISIYMGHFKEKSVENQSVHVCR